MLKFSQKKKKKPIVKNVLIFFFFFLVLLFFFLEVLHSQYFSQQILGVKLLLILI